MTIGVKKTNGKVLQSPSDLLERLREDEKSDPAAIYKAIEELVARQSAVNNMVYQYLRSVPDELRSDLALVADALPGDKSDTFELLSTGDAEKEHQVEHNLGYEPENFEITSIRGGYGQVQFSREKLSDRTFSYLKTNAPKGAVIRLRVY